MITERQLISANGQELDRLASVMGYKRIGLIVKESDWIFKSRLIKLNQKHICPHQDSSNRRSFDWDVICDDCGARIG